MSQSKELNITLNFAWEHPMLYYPPGTTLMNGVEMDNSVIANGILESVKRARIAHGIETGAGKRDGLNQVELVRYGPVIGGLTIDGNKLKGVESVQVDADPAKRPRVTVRFAADVQGIIDYVPPSPPPSPSDRP